MATSCPNHTEDCPTVTAATIADRELPALRSLAPGLVSENGLTFIISLSASLRLRWSLIRTTPDEYAICKLKSASGSCPQIFHVVSFTAKGISASKGDKILRMIDDVIEEVKARCLIASTAVDRLIRSEELMKIRPR
ncbi:hypothetical protein DL546_007106 [Coniochaeta pulveracea]|uniref:Uncharacterized protein n=1 Tax=Coniochaeta pulveracea TaxID=177199 RepID=A0A420YB02_9PEZI|nr:hypothetical protein DL546_007106 [Coniochaeta pulveracea]